MNVAEERKRGLFCFVLWDLTYDDEDIKLRGWHGTYALLGMNWVELLGN